MFGSRLSLSQLNLGHKRTGSYEINSAKPDSDLDENNNNNNNSSSISPLDQHDQRPVSASSVSSINDFNQNNARRFKKLRSISFSRFVYLKSTSYDITSAIKTNNEPLQYHSSPLPTAHDLANNNTNDHNNNNNNNNSTNPPPKDGVTLCTLGVGTTFGASVMPGKSHSVSVVTNEECTLLRVRRADFQEVFNEQSHLISDLESSPFYPFSSMNKSLTSASSDSGALTRIRPPTYSTSRFAKNRQASLHGHESVPLGRRISLASTDANHRTASSGLSLSGNDVDGGDGGGGGDVDDDEDDVGVNVDTSMQAQQEHQRQQQQRLASILSRLPNERTAEEVDIVFEELQHLKALSHLTNSVKKQLAGCVQSEHHSRQNTVIFNQGDAGHSWYIILRGSVNVVIVGKGVVCTLHDGDDFGKLALVNDAPRAATIVTNEPNCYFLRVEKQDFNTILRNVEANTVRLKEHGKEVLILQKVAIKEQPDAGQQQNQSGETTTTTTTSSGSSAGQPSGGLLAGLRTGISGTKGMNNHPQAGLLRMGSLGASSQSDPVALAGANVAPTAFNSSGQLRGLGAVANQAGGQSSVSHAAATTLAAVSQVTSSCALKYMVMAGTGEKMLEHLLETRIDGQTQTASLPLTKEALFQHDRVANYIQCHGDTTLEDFILTHKIFMPTGNLCQELLKQYQSSGQTRAPTANQNSNNNATTTTTATLQQQQQQQQQQQKHRQINSLVDDEYLVAKKRRVIKFVRFWMLINREHFFQQQQIYTFVMSLHQKVKLDAQRFSSLRPELEAITRIYELQLEESLESRHRGCQRWIEDVYGNILPIRRHLGPWQNPVSSSSSSSVVASGGSGSGAESQQQMAASEQFLASLHQRRFHHKLSTIQAEDELVFRVYCADHSYTTLKCRFDEQAGQIKQVAARNLKLDEKELILVHVKSNGERIIYNDQETNICTCLSVNGRLFVCPLEHIDAVSPLPEQDPFQEVYQSLSLAVSKQQQQQQQQQTAADENNANETIAGGGATGGGSATNQQQNLNQTTNPLGNSSNANLQDYGGQQQQQQQPIKSHLLSATPTNHADIKLQMSLSVNKFEEFSSRDIAYCLTQLAWSLLKNMHEFELVYTIFGRHNFKQITANLNVFLRHFNEIQFWVVTQICLTSSLSKRVQILRKFIKIAAHCKELQNLNAFFAIIMGLSNMAVARLTQTWERIPNKLKRTFSQFESQIDPSRNHRRYRIFLATLEPPIIPFMPLFLKDMTFAHEGNKTYLENGLINFEKMQMIAQALRTIRYCKSRSMKLDPSLCKFKSSIRSIDLFFRDLKIIDNQRTLTQMSHQLEHRKT